MPRFASVEEYLGSFPDDERAVLEEIRRRALAVVPDAGEKISYDMAAMTVDGRPFVHFAGWKKHVSLYPVPDAGDDADLAAALAPYAGAKGTLKFPLDRPVPYDLVERAIARLVAQRTS